MSDILSSVTPLTRSIIWLTAELSPDSAHYKAVDYLLNGLLTASLNSHPEAGSRVILSSNFNFPFHVYVTKEIIPTEYGSFLKLLQKDLAAESTILVIDEIDASSALSKKTPAEIQSKFQIIK
jgi:hypothetical protein